MERIILIKEEPRNASELVEVPVNASGLYRINFQDNQQLRSLVNQSVIIQGMRLIIAAVSSFGAILNFRNAPLTELVKCYLVLYCEGWEKAHYIPLLVLNDMSVPSTATPFRFSSTKFSNWRNVDWSKSYILYAGGTGGSDITTGTGLAYEFIFDVEYTKLDADGKEIIGPS